MDNLYSTPIHLGDAELLEAVKSAYLGLASHCRLASPCMLYKLPSVDASTSTRFLQFFLSPFAYAAYNFGEAFFH